MKTNKRNEWITKGWQIGTIFRKQNSKCSQQSETVDTNYDNRSFKTYWLWRINCSISQIRNNTNWSNLPEVIFSGFILVVHYKEPGNIVRPKVLKHDTVYEGSVRNHMLIGCTIVKSRLDPPLTENRKLEFYAVLSIKVWFSAQDNYQNGMSLTLRKAFKSVR
jgi:hypothetical protein